MAKAQPEHPLPVPQQCFASPPKCPAAAVRQPDSFWGLGKPESKAEASVLAKTASSMFTYPPICRLREVASRPSKVQLASRVRVHSLESRPDLNGLVSCRGVPAFARCQQGVWMSLQTNFQQLSICKEGACSGKAR